jgi:hypothetical protein
LQKPAQIAKTAIIGCTKDQMGSRHQPVEKSGPSGVSKNGTALSGGRKSRGTLTVPRDKYRGTQIDGWYDS